MPMAITITNEHVTWLRTLIAAWEDKYSYEKDVDPSATAEMIGTCRELLAALEEQYPTQEQAEAQDTERVRRVRLEVIKKRCQCHIRQLPEVDQDAAWKLTYTDHDPACPMYDEIPF
jgi:hypothetical protein